MEFQNLDDKIVCVGDAGETLGEIELVRASDGAVEITRTFVDPAARGMGLAGQLMEHAVARLRGEGAQVRPVCSYAEHWFDKHPDEADLLA